MPKLVIETFWNKVIPDGTAPLGSRVLPEYERKDITSYHNGGGWPDKTTWARNAKTLHRFQGFDEQGRAKFDLGRAYGIHSFQLVSIE